MSHHDSDQDQQHGEDQDQHGQGDGREHGSGEDQGQSPAVSEGGSGALNAESSLGGADSVPDTPDTNDTSEGAERTRNVPGRERSADGDLGVPDDTADVQTDDVEGRTGPATQR